MKFALDHTSRSPLFRQLEDQVLYAISVAELRPGDQLPSIRQLELELGINRNTVRRAYLELQAKGAILLRRGHAAEVAEQVAMGDIHDAGLADRAEELVVEMLRRCESWGLDGIQFANFVTNTARQHDVRYPKIAFVECNRGMADDISRRIGDRLGRHVEPFVIREESQAADLPSSVRFVLVPHWHLAETKQVLADTAVQVIQLSLRLDPACVSQLEDAADKRVIIVVRDPESTAGYRELVRKHAGSKHVDVALAEHVIETPAMLRKYDVAIHTTPCEQAVRSAANASLHVVELVFEPAAEELDKIVRRLFLGLKPQAQVALQ